MIRVRNHILLNEVTRLSWINEVKCNKLSVVTRATDRLISVLNEVSRASFITAGQSNDKKRKKNTHLFGTNIAECELQNIRANLERVTVQNANQESINNIANQIENIFANSAKQSFGTRTSKTDNKTHKNGLITIANMQETCIIIQEDYTINIKILTSKIY